MIAVLIAGVVAGFSYSLAAGSLAVAYRSSRTLNFALGGAGGFAAYTCMTFLDWHLPWAVAFVLTLVAGAAVGGATDAFVGRRLRRASELAAAMGIFGVLLVMQGLTEWIWGSNGAVLRAPYGASQINLGSGAVLRYSDLLSVVIAVVASIALMLVMYRTRFGLSMRAASAGPVTAQTVGIRVRVTTTAGWAMGGVLGAASAVFVCSIGTLLPTTYSGFLFLALVALVVGGLTSIWGVLVGGVAFGVVLSVLEYELSTRLTFVFAYLLLAGLLLYRPQGLLGRPERLVSEPQLIARRTQRVLKSRPWWRSLFGSTAFQHLETSPNQRFFTRRSVVSVGFVIGIMLLLWYDGPPLVQLSLTQVLSTFVAVMGLDILMGYCGQISLAHGAFLGVGAYASAIAIVHLHMPIGLAFPVGTLAAAVIGVVVGLPAVRLSGLYFAQITLMFALVVPELIVYFSSVTGGSNGLTVPQLNSFSPFEIFLLYGAITGGCALLVRVMVGSALGRRWRAVRDDAAAAASLGQRTSLTKLGAFAIGCGLAGLGGVMQAITVGSLSPESYPVWESIYLQAAQVIGGMTSMLGNLLGAFFVAVVPVYTGGSRVPPDFIFGAVFVVVLLVTPQGIGPLVARGWEVVLDLPATVQRLRTSRPQRKGQEVTVQAALPARDNPAPGRTEPSISMNGHSHCSAPALAVYHLRAGYSGSEVLHGVDLEVGAGEVVGLVGPNGAGKSTLLRAITGLILPDRGSVQLYGREITDVSPFRLARQGVAHVVEGRGIFPDLTVAEQLQLGRLHAGSSGRLGVRKGTAGVDVVTAEAGTREVDEVIDLFPVLGGRLRQRGGTLSGGEQQMLALARSLLMNPAILLLDEPLLGLAPVVRDVVFAALRRISSSGLAILIVEQNVKQVLELCSRAYVLAGGEVVRSGDTRTLASDTHLAEAYFGLEAAAP